MVQCIIAINLDIKNIDKVDFFYTKLLAVFYQHVCSFYILRNVSVLRVIYGNESIIVDHVNNMILLLSCYQRFCSYCYSTIFHEIIDHNKRFFQKIF